MTLVVLCMWGSKSRTQKICPVSSRNYPGHVLFHSNECAPSKPFMPTAEVEAVKSELEDISPTSNVKPVHVAPFVPGKCVCLHSGKLVKQHIPCRIVRVIGERYWLCCWYLWYAIPRSGVRAPK